MAHVRTGNVARDVESRHNRDIGAAAATTDGLDALGRLSAVKGSDSGSLEPDTGGALGLGTIERRKATAEELARLDEPEPVKAIAESRAGPAMHLLRPAAAAMAESRARGAARHVEVMAGRRADRAKEEEPMATATSLEVPCGTCLHDPVCALKGQLAPFLVMTEDAETIKELAPGLRIVDVVRLERIECDHQLVSLRRVEPQPIRAEHGGERWRSATAEEVKELRQPGHHARHAGEAKEKAERAAKAIAAVARHGGDRRAAAAELGMRPNALAMVLKFADRHPAAEATA